MNNQKKVYPLKNQNSPMNLIIGKLVIMIIEIEIGNNQNITISIQIMNR